MELREIRVRPIVRYTVTDFEEFSDGTKRSTSLGLYDNASAANRVAQALAYQARVGADQRVAYEPVRALRIDHVAGPRQPHAAVRWELREVAADA